MPHSTCPVTNPCPIAPASASTVLNRDGLVFIGRRIDGPEHVDMTHVWQMPQGGIDPGEDPWPAALRELYEETNIRSVEKLGEIADWLTLRHSARDRRAGLERQVSRPDAEMVRAALHRRRAARSTSRIPPADMSRNSSNGAGSRCKTFPTWSCRSSARSTSAWSQEFAKFAERGGASRRTMRASMSGGKRRLQRLELIELVRELVALAPDRWRRRCLPRHP